MQAFYLRMNLTKRKKKSWIYNKKMSRGNSYSFSYLTVLSSPFSLWVRADRKIANSIQIQQQRGQLRDIDRLFLGQILDQLCIIIARKARCSLPTRSINPPLAKRIKGNNGHSSQNNDRKANGINRLGIYSYPRTKPITLKYIPIKDKRKIATNRLVVTGK